MIVSKQDASQVLKLVYDDASQSLRITGSSIPGSMTVDQADGSLLHVTVDASALPAGAATEVKQDDQIAQLADIQTAVETSATNSAGKATEAKQDTAITALGTIDSSVVDVEVAVTTGLSNKATEATLQSVADNTLDTTTAVNSLQAKTASSLVAVPFDELEITYVGATTDIDVVTYKLATATVATVTLSYDGQGRLTGVVRT